LNSTLKNILIVIGIPTLYAVILRLFFGIEKWNELFEVMSISFLFCLPTIVGALTVYLSDIEKVKNISYRIMAPWKPILVFLVITLAFAIEGWACWLMVLPLFLLASSVGGIIGGYLKMNKQNDKFNISALMLLPFLIAPLESLIEKIPASYEANTFIDIDAKAETIWDNVTRVREIEERDDTGWINKFLGFPRPVKAELDFEGVGAYREAIFTNGLVFHETVTNYKDNELMIFNIKAYPHEIPSTTLDEHVVIGGKYFDVLEGKYELERLNSNQYRLHLSSTFTMKTNFNFYAGWWGKLIMKDIQNNILKIEKKRAEQE